MRVARFDYGGKEWFGIVDGDRVQPVVGNPLFGSFEPAGADLPLAAVKLLAPVAAPSKIVCVGMNYSQHAADMGASPPDNPLLFLKPTTAIVGPGQAIELPNDIGKVVHEGELVVVIGARAKDVAASDASRVIFGYTIGNDVSAREVMASDGQWARAKGYDTFAPLGPWIETDVNAATARITTFVDGELRREGSTADMTFSVERIVAFASSVFTLLPGDVIMTGTPPGSGQVFAGQTVDISIDGIGTLSNPVRSYVASHNSR